MENQDYLACRKTVREWEVGKGLLNGWATVFGVLASLTIIGRTALLFGQYQATILYSGILLLLAVAVYRLMWWRRKGTRHESLCAWRKRASVIVYSELIAGLARCYIFQVAFAWKGYLKT